MTQPVSVAADRFAAWQNESREIDRLTPLFVIGPHKCGTTWLYRTLAAHPEAAGLGLETNLFNVRLNSVKGAIAEFARPSRLLWDKQEWITLDPEEDAFVQRQIADRIIAKGIRKIRPLDDPKLKLFLDKTPAHSTFAPQIAALYPNTKFICCVRDPRDAALSSWKHFGLVFPSVRAQTLAQHTPGYLANYYIPFLRASREFGATLGPSRYMEVSYEARKDDPEASLLSILKFLQLRTDQAAIDACNEGGSFEKYAQGRKPGQEAPAFIRKGVSGDWVNHMSREYGESLLQFVEEALGEWKEPPCFAHEGSSDSVKSHAAA